ncbi:Sentrin-specific protease 2 [Acropora cervicornis]|uniref:Sentrin-specific protease 2 n=1 Tax=Acropora cervicornis TaxID=6130 RepID=A0AAD9V5K3_ACRCE|nr:Sentrin-specific protease 2 [Acropora cervicornis]
MPFDLSEWKLAAPKDIPEQLNGCDCGVFACKYAEYLSRGAKFDFDQEDIPETSSLTFYSPVEDTDTATGPFRRTPIRYNDNCLEKRERTKRYSLLQAPNGLRDSEQEVVMMPTG